MNDSDYYTNLVSIENTKNTPAANGPNAPANISNRYRVDAAHLGKWTAAVSRMRNGTTSASNARLLVVGDSTSAGVGTSVPNTVTKSWPSQLVPILNQAFGSAVVGGGIPQPNSYTDTRWTTSTWTRVAVGNGIGWGGSSNFYTGSAGNTLVYADPRVTADTFDVYLITGTGAEPVTVTATGGTPLAVTTLTAGPDAILKVTVTAASASTSNTVTITANSGSGYVRGVVMVEPYLSTKSAIIVADAGVPSTSTAGWNQNSTNIGGIPCITAYAPDLTLIMLGINDSYGGNGGSPSTYIANLQNIINAAAVSGSVGILSFLPSGGVGNASLVPVQQAMVANLAGLTNYAYWDLFSRTGGEAAYKALGFMSGDDVHANDLGYGDIAGFVGAGLREF